MSGISQVVCSLPVAMAQPNGDALFTSSQLSGAAAAWAGGRTRLTPGAGAVTDGDDLDILFGCILPEMEMRPGDSYTLLGPFASSFNLEQPPYLADVQRNITMPGGPDTPPQQLLHAPLATPLDNVWVFDAGVANVPQQPMPRVLARGASTARRAHRQARGRVSKLRLAKPKKPKGVWLAIARFAQRPQSAAEAVQPGAADSAPELSTGAPPPAGDAPDSSVSDADNAISLQPDVIAAAVDFNSLVLVEGDAHVELLNVFL